MTQVVATSLPIKVGDTVRFTRPLRREWSGMDLVIESINDGKHPLEGGGLLPVKSYALRWPDSRVTVHLRHDFELIEVA